MARATRRCDRLLPGPLGPLQLGLGVLYAPYDVSEMLVPK
jgi:hypothetical protein